MKKLLTILAILGFMFILAPSSALAQEDSSKEKQVVQSTNDQAKSGVEESVGIHQALKIKFIEGSPSFMGLIAICLIIGLAFCLERIIYLSLSDLDPKSLLNKVGKLLDSGDIEGAKAIARDTRGPIASIIYQGLLRLDEGPEIVERSVVSYGSVQSSLLEKNLSWITLFIAITPSIGFLGTVVGMVLAFDNIQKAGDLSPTVVAGGMKVALLTTIAALIVAVTLQIIYNYLLAKVETIMYKMEDTSISFMDHVLKYNIKNKKI